MAQQSMGGYGQFRNNQGRSFGGGYGGGGVGGATWSGSAVVETDALRSGVSGGQNRPPRPEDDQTAGLWTTKTAILTPGDQFEYKLKVEKGETIFAGATSDAFDPALSIEDSKKKILTKNDDRSDGDQSPFVEYRFADAGDYTLKVLSYRSISGGKFTLMLRSFVATDMPLGLADEKDLKEVYLQGQNRAIFRIPAQKGKIYDVRSVAKWLKLSGGRQMGVGVSPVTLFGPTGVVANDYARIDTPDGGLVFQALADGNYYAEYRVDSQNVLNSTAVYHTTLREVATVAAKSSGDLTVDLAPDELKLVEFPVTAEQIVRTTIKGDQFGFRVSLPNDPNAASGPGAANNGDQQPYGACPEWAWFRLNIDSDKDVVRVFQAAGTVRIAFRSQSGFAEKIDLKNTDSLPTWDPGAPLDSSLEIGDSHLYLIKSTKSELMRVNAQASHFLPRLDIFRLNGALANSLCNRQTHIAKDDLYFPDEGTFVVRISCEGNGGSGDFAMTRTALTPIPYTLGSVQTLELNGQNFGLYSVDLEAGKRYQLVIDQPFNPLEADLLDDDGQFLISQSLSFDKVTVQYFVPTRSGRHRLWLRGGSGTRHFQLKLHVPPSLGDAEKGG